MEKKQQSVHLTGPQFRAFYEDPQVWPDGACHDDALVLANGKVLIGDECDPEFQDVDDPVALLADDAQVVIESGVIIGGDGDFLETLITAAQRWLTQQTDMQFVVSVPKGQEAAFRQAVAALSGTVILGPNSSTDRAEKACEHTATSPDPTH